MACLLPGELLRDEDPPRGDGGPPDRGEGDHCDSDYHCHICHPLQHCLPGV